MGLARAWLSGLSRWRQRLLAFALGAVAVLAMPPTYQVYLLLPALSALVVMATDAPTRWRAFIIGWWFGAGFFTSSLYWVSFALLVDGARFAWLIPVAVLGFAFGLGLFCAFTALAVRAFSGPWTAKVLIFAAVWTLLEWVRSWLLTGFPWNPLGSVWAFSDTLAQGAAVVGVFGLSLLAALIASAPVAFLDQGRTPRILAALLAVVCLAWGAGGQHRLANAIEGEVDGVRLRLVQPNIPQSLKWLPELRSQHMVAQMELATAPPLGQDPLPTHIIWAETMAPFFIADFASWRRMVGQATPQGGLTLLGAPRRLEQGTHGEFRVANALLAFDPAGRVVGHYDKSHLVPFGEYVPLKDWLPLEKITYGSGGFTPGSGPQTLHLPGLPPLSPLICYEVIFPGEVTDRSGEAKWLLNLTNDAWYGKTAGPHQHFVSTRLRAIEEGLPMVRVASTGISGIIDAYGRVRVKLALGEKGFIDGGLPLHTLRKSPYSEWGNMLPLSLAVVFLLLGIALSTTAKNH